MKKKSFIGLKFGKLLVLEKLHYDKKNNVFWYNCQCDCGKRKAVRSSNLTNITKGCGCEKGTYNRINEIGKQYGFLKVLEPSKNKDPNCMLWSCLCICGLIKDYKGNSLRRGIVKSCGCKKGEIVSKKLTKPLEEVGLNRIYKSYLLGAKERGYSFNLTKEEFAYFLHKECYYCNSKDINICNLKNRIFKYNGLDRLDNTLGYTKDNCVPCCNICNVMKLDLTKEKFLNQIIKIYEKIQNNKKRTI